MQVKSPTFINSLTNAFTVEAWVKQSTGTPTALQTLVSHFQTSFPASGGTQGGFLLRLNYDRQVEFYVYSNAANNTRSSVLSNVVVPAGSWHHVAGVFDYSNRVIRIFIDGQLQGENSATAPAARADCHLYIGIDNNSNSNAYYSGLIDEVRVSNSALYSGTFTPQPELPLTSTTLGLWHFEQNTNDAANGYTGNLSGGTFVPDVAPPTLNQPPSITINSPTNGQSFASPASISINASASDPDGFITRLEIFGDGNNLPPSPCNGSPCSATWNVNSVATHTILVRATDNQGAVVDRSINVLVTSGTPPNQPPTINLSGPSGPFVAPASVTVAAAVSDPDGDQVSVQFYKDGIPQSPILQGSPYNMQFTNLAARGTPYAISAVADDHQGHVVTSTTFNIQVNPPSSGCNPAGAGTGLRGDYFNGDFSLAAAGALPPVGTTPVVSRVDPVVDFSWMQGAPAQGLSTDFFGVRWRGQIQPRCNETYTFSAASDDGVRLRVNGQLLIDGWRDQSTELTGTPISLTAGVMYDVVLEYYEKTGEAGIHLSWQSPSTGKQIVPQSQLFPAAASVPPSATNLALNKPALQSSLDWGGVPARAVDGNTNGDYNAGSVTHTLGQSQPWWQVDLAASSTIQSIKIYNRTDCCGERLNNSYVLVSQVPFGSKTLAELLADSGVFKYHIITAPSPLLTVPVNQTGRYVRVQLENYDFLSLAEVEVWGTSSAPPPPPPPPNQRPTAVPGGPYNGTTNTAVQFNGSASSDPDGTIVSYQWNFGDSTTGSGPTPTHAYGVANNYTVSLTVTDNGGLSSTATTTASITNAAPPPPPPSGGNLSRERVDPINRTGQAGEDLFSGNYNWTLSLLDLPGRAGLDLGLSLSYNSLVWTKNESGTSMTFNADKGFPAPGFRLGFPVIEKQKYTSQANTQAYLMILPSGARVELRQVDPNLPTIYESADSSYIQFDESTGIARTPDGTQLSYQQRGVDLRCVLITDRNGNFISASYDSVGRITQVIDTLGRPIDFIYDQTTGNLRFIQRTWDGTPHNWAEFSYQLKSLTPSFSIPTATGTPSSFQALIFVKVADTSSYGFDYTPFGQVNKITRYGGAGDGHTLASTSYDLSVSGSQPDCPRFTQRTDSAENWRTVTSSFTFDRGSGSGQVTLPDNTIVREEHATAGYRKGLTTKSETISGGIVKKSVVLTWEQDNEGLGYPNNPRVKDVLISDDQFNRRHTSTSYTTFGLPSDFYEYDSDTFTLLRQTHVDYNFEAAYVNRRILGLPTMQTVSDRSGNLVSKITYGYDTLPLADTSANPTNHNPAYNTSFIVGRGNLSGVKRWNVTDPLNDAQAISVQQIGYFKTGTTRFINDARGHGPAISYSDNFSDGIPRNTFAYPTTITDPDNNSSTVKYNYGLGVVTSSRDPKGAEMRMEYNDPAGRVTKRQYFDAVAAIPGTYTTFEYPTNMTEIRIRTLLDPGIETYSAQAFDGVGRVTGTVKEFSPASDVIAFSGQKITYDSRGRIRQQSNPTQISYSPGQPVSSWTPIGDDAGTGWVFTTQDYDWNGRPTVTTNPDNTFKIVDYTGCGCAGGEIVTLTDEVGRKQRNISDALGRIRLTQVLNLDSSAYSTTAVSYNGRDQVERVRQYRGAEGSNFFQDTVMTYDGHGRLRTQHLPQYDAGKTTIYDYNSDDTLQRVTDPRGATATYDYNNRHLLTSIIYGAQPSVATTEATTDPSEEKAPAEELPPPDSDPKGEPIESGGGTIAPPPGDDVAPPSPGPVETQAPIPVTAPVEFQYDEAGNRLRMTDGSGLTVYTYDTWSRITREKREFNGLVDSGNVRKQFFLRYEYNLAGEVKKVTDETFGGDINYTYNQAGQLTGVAGTPYGGITTYASNMNYRAWGGLKHLDYGNNPRQLNLTYNTRLQVATMKFQSTSGGPDSGSWEYYYHPDGRINYSRDRLNALWNRRYVYDHVGRLTQAFTGTEAYNEGQQGGQYFESFSYDVWNNMTSRSGVQVGPAYTTTYTNNRDQKFMYDAAGHMIRDDRSANYGYDAAGRLVSVSRGTNSWVYDADGRQAKWSQGSYSTYRIVSSVIGKVVIELNGSGNKQRTNIYVGAQLLARQEGNNVFWQHVDASNMSSRESIVGSLADPVEKEPLGAQVNFYVEPVIPELVVQRDNPSTGCLMDGVPASCNDALHLLLQTTGNSQLSLVGYLGRNQKERPQRDNPRGSVTFDPYGSQNLLAQNRPGRVVPSPSILIGDPPPGTEVGTFYVVLEDKDSLNRLAYLSLLEQNSGDSFLPHNKGFSFLLDRNPYIGHSSDPYIGLSTQGTNPFDRRDWTSFTQVGLNVPLGLGFSWAPALTRDDFGQVYLSIFSFNLGKSLVPQGPSLSVTKGWVDNSPYIGADALSNVLTGFSFQVGVNVPYITGSVGWSPFSDWARVNQLGLTSTWIPSGGLTASWTWQLNHR